MALPIADTPILKGKEAEAFINIVKENENKKLSKEEVKRSYELYVSILQNSLKEKLAKHNLDSVVVDIFNKNFEDLLL